MEFKSWPTTSTVQREASIRQLGRHTDPIIYTVEECRSDGRKKTSKRSERSLERPSKRRRTNQSLSEGCSPMLSGLSGSEHAGTSASVYTGPLDKAASGGTLKLSRPTSEPVLGSLETKTSSKRKSSSDEEQERPKKRSRGLNPDEGCTQIISSHSKEEEAGTSIPTIPSKKSIQKKTEEPRKRSRKTNHNPNEGSTQQATVDTATQQPSTSSASDTVEPRSRAAFDAKYKEGKMLGYGGYAKVFAGYRKEDNLPVAMKHIPQRLVKRRSMVLDGEVRRVPQEVMLMLRIQEGGSSAAVTLLDWYDLNLEVILVLERPVPCVDLVSYINRGSTPLSESHVKVLTKQLVDALIEIHSRGVFHRDIKLDNILIETGSDVPRVRILDFGCGTFLSDIIYFDQPGTYEYASPEWFKSKKYRADPLTVWQLGVVVYTMLHGQLPFRNYVASVHYNPLINESLSADCRGFLRRCLEKIPDLRASLEALRDHPWLV